MNLDNLSTGPDLAAYERIKSIEKQVRELRMGMIDTLKCPFCGLFNMEGDDLCCPTFKRAWTAVMDRLDQNESLETADKVAQRVN